MDSCTRPGLTRATGRACRSGRRRFCFRTLSRASDPPEEARQNGNVLVVHARTRRQGPPGSEVSTVCLVSSDMPHFELLASFRVSWLVSGCTPRFVIQSPEFHRGNTSSRSPAAERALFQSKRAHRINGCCAARRQNARERRNDGEDKNYG